MKVAFVPVWAGNPYHKELEAALRKTGIEVKRPGDLKRFFADVTSGRERIEVLHLHAMPHLDPTITGFGRYVLFFLRLLLLKRRGLAVVWTVHDLDNHDSRYARVEDWVNRKIAKKLDGLIVHGVTAKSIVESRWGRNACSEIAVIPHGHYVDSYPHGIAPDVARSSFGLAESDFVFLFLGLIRPYKGVVEMVGAFKASCGPNDRLVIAGRPISDSIKAGIENAIGDDARVQFFPGHVDDSDVQRYMNAADVVVLPYRRIMTSGAAVLAMSFGKVCIAPRAGCVPDMLDESGAVFFDPEIEGDIARAFERARILSPRLREMGKSNFERASKWDWDGIATATAALYRRCIAKRRGDLS